MRKEADMNSRNETEVNNENIHFNIDINDPVSCEFDNQSEGQFYENGFEEDQIDREEDIFSGWWFTDLLVDCRCNQERMSEEKKIFFEKKVLEYCHKNGGISANEAMKCFCYCLDGTVFCECDKLSEFELSNISIIFELIYLNVKDEERDKFLKLLADGNFGKKFLVEGSLKNDLDKFLGASEDKKIDNSEKGKTEGLSLRKKKNIKAYNISVNNNQEDIEMKDIDIKEKNTVPGNLNMDFGKEDIEMENVNVEEEKIENFFLQKKRVKINVDNKENLKDRVLSKKNLNKEQRRKKFSLG